MNCDDIPTTDHDSLKALSTAELITAAREAVTSDAYFDVVVELRRRGTDEVYNAASELCRSSEADDRSIGVDILSQFDFGNDPSPPARKNYEIIVLLLLGMIKTEEDPEVLSSIGFAFGHLHDARGIAELVRLSRHSSSTVRNGAAFGLAGHSDRRAIRALIYLSRDECTEVRDWATFALGTQIENNTREIREALYQRLTDTDRDVRGEAYWGLAVRGDQRVTEPLIAELQSPDLIDDRPGSLVISAASAMADPRLLPYLVRLRESYPSDSQGRQTLEDAIDACRTGPDSPYRAPPVRASNRSM